MKALIVEDDFTSRLVLQGILKKFGEVHIAVHGLECIAAFAKALNNGIRYDLVCLDIMMPEMDGHEALKRIREMETQAGISARNEVKVLMTTALDDPKNVFEAYFKGGATSYLVKPVHAGNVIKELQKFCLIEPAEGEKV